MVAIIPEEECLNIWANGKKLTKVNQFKYLGTLFISLASNNPAIDSRISSRNIGVLYPLVKDRRMPIAVKVSNCKTVLRPVQDC